MTVCSGRCFTSVSSRTMAFFVSGRGGSSGLTPWGVSIVISGGSKDLH